MVAIPVPRIVQRGEEQVRVLKLLQDELAVATGRRTKDERREVVIGVGNAFANLCVAFVRR